MICIGASPRDVHLKIALPRREMVRNNEMKERKLKRVKRDKKEKKEQKKQTNPTVWGAEQSFSLVNLMGNHAEVKKGRYHVNPMKTEMWRKCKTEEERKEITNEEDKYVCFRC